MTSSDITAAVTLLQICTGVAFKVADRWVEIGQLKDADREQLVKVLEASKMEGFPKLAFRVPGAGGKVT